MTHHTWLKANIAVHATQPIYVEQAERLAQTLAMPLYLPAQSLPPELAFVLEYVSHRGEGCLQLRPLGKLASGPTVVDFVRGTLGHRTRYIRKQYEALSKAVGLAKGGLLPTVLDATTGLGRDAFILASLGYTVILVERVPVILALLQDGLIRALGSATTARAVTRMRLVAGDSSVLLAQLAEHERPQVIYLDPMYPKRDKSALVKKEMRALRALAGDDEDAPTLLAVALAVARLRVVVKRSRLAPALKGPPPSFQLLGNTTRFDVYRVPC